MSVLRNRVCAYAYFLVLLLLGWCLMPFCLAQEHSLGRCESLSPRLDNGYLNEKWRSDELAYWSCRLKIPQEDIAAALKPADLTDALERLTPFRIGTTNFLMVGQSGGNADCLSFDVVAKFPKGWHKIWHLPDDHIRCQMSDPPRILFKGRGFTLRLPESTDGRASWTTGCQKGDSCLIYPAEAWAYQWTGRSFKLIQAPRSYAASVRHQYSTQN